MRKVKYYKCPECGKKYNTLGGWGEHVQTMHPGTMPEDFTVARYFYFTLTGKTAGSCIMCKSPTQWNESTGKYDRFCTNPKCKEEYVKIAKKRMRDKYGKEYLLNDPDMQRKMLAAKHISGEYAFSDGSGKLGYVGTYEKDFLMMMDKFMHYSATDIIAPSPHTYYYEYQGEKHFYIPDFYVPNLNLEIEIKAQDNTHPKIQAIDKVKERLKDEMMMHNPKINYLKINDKNYNNFFDYLLNLKTQIDDKEVSPATKNSAEFRAATESAYNYYTNDEEAEYIDPQFDMSPATEELISEVKTEDMNPVIFFFGSAIHPFLKAVDYQVHDRFNTFGIVLSDPSDQRGYSFYNIEPSAPNLTGDENSFGGLYAGLPFNCYYNKHPISEVLVCGSSISFVTYLNSKDYQKVKERVEKTDIAFHNWDSNIEIWLSHPDKYRYICNKILENALGEYDRTFESRDYILLNITNASDARNYWSSLDVSLAALNSAPMGPARERQSFEETVLEESFYGYLPSDMETSWEDSFSGWEEAIIDDLDPDDNDFEEAEESYIFSTEDYEQNLDKWKPGGSNILFITGLSGSGKSSSADKLAKENNALKFEFDIFENRNGSFDRSTKRIYEQLLNRNPKYKKILESDIARKDNEIVYNNDYLQQKNAAIKDLVKMCNADKAHLYIIEGIQIYEYLNPEFFKDKPLIIKGTSATKSFMRALKREGIVEWLKAPQKFPMVPSVWLKDEKYLNNFTKQMKSSKENAIDEPAEESLLLKTKFNKVKVKGTLSLTKFTRQDLTQEVLDKYKEKCASFGHCRISNMSKGYLYTDKSDNIVGFVNVVRKQDNIKWIQALNIQPQYQGYGLYEQIMKVAVRELGGTDIETPPKNDTAKLVYQKFGFKTYTNETTRHAMTIRSDAKAEKYDAKAKPNATTIVEAGLHPVYVMLLDAKMGFGNVVKFFTNAPYSHALIGFDSSMRKMYSFATRDGHTMVPLGFSEEDITTYAKKSSKSKYALYVKLVDTKDYKLMKTKLATFMNSKADFRYDIGGAVKAFMGKHNANEKRYFCSGFVAYILNSGKSQVTEKDYDLTKPMDLTDVKNIHLVDMGLCKDYNQAYVEKKVKQIFEKHYMHKEKDSHHQPIDEEEELKQDKKENNEE